MFKILFICTHNRCRSILSEAITNHIAQGKILAKSAGSQPVGEVHPLSLHYLEEAKIPITGLRSKSWAELEEFGADLVVTVCDRAAKEVCPVWFGKSVRVHWGLVDPSKVTESEERIAEAFRTTISEITKRATAISSLPLETLSPNELSQAFQQLGAS